MIQDDNIEKREETKEVPIEDQNPLCPIAPVTMEERREWSKPWKNSLIVNLLRKN